ncbi:MAG TPA: protein kinase [Gemmatimonadaceae bacterium]|nr:protein kinase [Gemmatimonadaceae bacterium]
MTSVDESTRAAWSASLRRSPVLRHLSEDRLARLIDDGELTTFADGAIIAGDESTACEAFLLVDGACDVARVQERVRLEAPALVGEIAVLTGTPALDRVRAVGAVTAIVIPRERFLAAIRTSAEAGQELTNVVADRLCTPGSIGRVGRFLVEGVMGEGGSGRVLRARHPLLGIPLALKMLSHALALSPDGPRAFIREASLLVHLDHPGIVRVLDAFEAHGTFFIVMPWIEGATLREHIDRHSSLRVEQVLQIAEETLDALAVLHAAGLVHRDVKPSNLLVRPSGRVVLIDLGIACQRDASASRRLVGSPSYCSPEQILGRPVDGRSDVYSLACTLYELVFGRPPFVGDAVDAVIESHLRATPSFDIAPVVPMGEPFVRWLRRCLSRTRAGRPDAAQARAELRALAPTTAVERMAPRARVTVPMPMVLDDVEAGARG